MKNEKFLQTMDGLDEKFIAEADRDVNAWLGSMEGEVVTVDSVRRTSPWKILTAATIAAAVFGAVVLAKNMINLPKPDVSASTDVTPDDQLVGYQIENLIFDESAFFDSTPNSGRWQILEYKTPRFGEQSVDGLIKAAADFGVSIDESDIMVARNDGLSALPLSDVDFAEWDRFLDGSQTYYPFTEMYYDSDDLYIKTIPSAANWIGVVNKNIGPWNPDDDLVLKHVEVIYPFEETRTCVLDGKTVKIADAVKNAMEIISERGMFPKEFDADIDWRRMIDLYTYENGNQALWIELTYTFDGVQYVSPSCQSLYPYQATYKPVLYFGMKTENSIDWMYQFMSFAGTEFSSQDCAVNISLDDTLKLVSAELAQSRPKKTYKVGEVQLVYADRSMDGGNALIIEPTWFLRLLNEDDRYDDYLEVYVSAVDGTVNIFNG